MKNIIIVFEDIRKNPDLTFRTLFESAAQKLKLFDKELKVPRLSGLQKKKGIILIPTSTKTL